MAVTEGRIMAIKVVGTLGKIYRDTTWLCTLCGNENDIEEKYCLVCGE